MLQDDAGRTGFDAAAVGPTESPSETWVFETDGVTAGQVAWGGFTGGAVADGTVYFTSGSTVQAVDAASGQPRWEATPTSGHPWITNPAVAGDTVFVGSEGDQKGRLHALAAADGSERWQLSLQDGITIPSVANGFVYMADRRRVHAVDVASGHPRFAYNLQHVRPTPPVVGSGTAYFSDYDTTKLYAIDAGDGSTVWTEDMGPEKFPEGHPVAVADGVVYLDSGDVHAFDATDGAELWRTDFRTALPSTWLAVGDGQVYVPVAATTYEGDNEIRVFDAKTGDSLWTYQTGKGVTAAPAVTATTVYVATKDKTVLALAADDGELRWEYDLGTTPGAPVVAGGSVYVSSWGKDFHALGGDAQGTPTTPESGAMSIEPVDTTLRPGETGTVQFAVANETEDPIEGVAVEASAESEALDVVAVKLASGRIGPGAELAGAIEVDVAADASGTHDLTLTATAENAPTTSRTFSVTVAEGTGVVLDEEDVTLLSGLRDDLVLGITNERDEELTGLEVSVSFAAREVEVLAVSTPSGPLERGGTAPLIVAVRSTPQTEGNVEFTVTLSAEGMEPVERTATATFVEPVELDVSVAGITERPETAEGDRFRPPADQTGEAVATGDDVPVTFAATSNGEEQLERVRVVPKLRAPKGDWRVAARPDVDLPFDPTRRPVGGEWHGPDDRPAWTSAPVAPRTTHRPELTLLVPTDISAGTYTLPVEVYAEPTGKGKLRRVGTVEQPIPVTDDRLRVTASGPSEPITAGNRGTVEFDVEVVDAVERPRIETEPLVYDVPVEDATAGSQGTVSVQNHRVTVTWAGTYSAGDTLSATVPIEALSFGESRDDFGYRDALGTRTFDYRAAGTVPNTEETVRSATIPFAVTVEPTAIKPLLEEKRALATKLDDHAVPPGLEESSAVKPLLTDISSALANGNLTEEQANDVVNRLIAGEEIGVQVLDYAAVTPGEQMFDGSPQLARRAASLMLSTMTSLVIEIVTAGVLGKAARKVGGAVAKKLSDDVLEYVARAQDKIGTLRSKLDSLPSRLSTRLEDDAEKIVRELEETAAVTGTLKARDATGFLSKQIDAVTEDLEHDLVRDYVQEGMLEPSALPVIPQVYPTVLKYEAERLGLLDAQLGRLHEAVAPAAVSNNGLPGRPDVTPDVLPRTERALRDLRWEIDGRLDEVEEGLLTDLGEATGKAGRAVSELMMGNLTDVLGHVLPVWEAGDLSPVDDVGAFIRNLGTAAVNLGNALLGLFGNPAGLGWSLMGLVKLSQASYRGIEALRTGNPTPFGG